MDFEESQVVIRAYGEALKRSSAEVGFNPLFPEGKLPYPKGTIKEAIRVAYSQTDDYETRQFLVDAYVKLAAFVAERKVNEVAQWLRAGISGDKPMQDRHHQAAVSILSESLDEMAALRAELLPEAD